MAHLEKLLNERLAYAFEVVAGGPADPALRRSAHAHFQADGALPLAQRLGRAPRDIAADVLRNADLADLVAAIEISGPGFINLTVSDATLSRLVADVAADPRFGVPVAAHPDVVPIDYSAPNVAKEMHVGHLRSTVIGDAAARLLSWLGHEVIRANHLGDWGTPFGMLIEHMLDVGETEAAHELSVGDLSGFYQAARVKFDADPGFAERSRQRVVALQGGDEQTLALWRLLGAESEKYFLAVYDKLDVTLTATDFYGESFYNDRLGALVDELDRLGLLRESGGAQCVFPTGFTGRDGEPLPVIVRKRDGGYGYGATDLATIRYRTQELKATRLLYVVGSPQRQHLEMVYQTAREAGWLVEPARATHVGFGSVLGSDGKMLRTRAGGTIKLIDLLDEAVARADAVIREKNPDLDPQTRAQVAQAVGIGAIKYSDLSVDRVKDYVFDWDRMLAFEGNTAPYLQYAHARIRSIFTRGNIEPPQGRQTVLVAEPAERALALELLAFAPVIDTVAETLEFHRLAGYLHTLASTFTTFYEHCPVLRSEGEVRQSRLALCDLTARTLAQGLDLLGISAPARM
ncbi:arginine--tRNA ligase [Longispora fulva]|uniref:Arginine--tRNA ligase n=1 Tax=Longispora fulva TaxID=619741 RepID=A0A8J7KKM7_9ACTN|nr:arginine--tRNA ligase [Longispora fulva]MBG6138319.1 arginyl-tRNA synthetase [Longispora fulva]GIG60571.1 arginine--tRNA ligase [Longispora fulva]